jgi:hypothetical protein
VSSSWAAGVDRGRQREADSAAVDRAHRHEADRGSLLIEGVGVRLIEGVGVVRLGSAAVNRGTSVRLIEGVGVLGRWRSNRACRHLGQRV